MAELVQALLRQIPDDDQTTVITIKHDTIAPASATIAQLPTSHHPSYDPSVAYILELCSIAAVRGEDCIQSIGKAVFSAIFELLKDSTRWHPITLSRVAFYALFVLKKSYVRGHSILFMFFKAHRLIRIMTSLKYTPCFILSRACCNSWLAKHRPLF